MSKIHRKLFMIGSKFISVKTLFDMIKKKFSRNQSFNYNGKKLDYFYHSYNNNRLTERTIEIPILRHYLEKHNPIRVLEIGNVTNHYYTYFCDLKFSKLVIDKFEIASEVVNEDIIDYVSEEKFKFIFSISTFEHFDSDRGRNTEYIKGNSKLSSYAADAIFHVSEDLLAERGVFIIICPLGYAEEFDETIFRKGLYDILPNGYVIEFFYLRKVGEIAWRQVEKGEIRKTAINEGFRGVNELVVIIVTKNKKGGQ